MYKRHKKGVLSNPIAIDDCPFSKDHKGDVPIVGTVFAGLRLDGVLVDKVRKDGANATDRIYKMIKNSKFYGHCNLIILQGINLAGFNVIDIHALNKKLARPVMVVARRFPDFKSIQKALLKKVRGGQRKWRLIESAGPMEKCHNCYVQRAGLTKEQAADTIEFFTINGHIPEPLRVAHLIAGAIGNGTSRGRV